ncbi:hypothetical protein [Cohnella cholangitidis]|uniref:Uncharacterized protein n=1 Tax=Cohnella cholangitidis TaxID=2598458 RepID=A0A7G5BU68_9BACL|nr:hypothetical protein [Cohnella cholangitidis]QMV40502.1 hypothetical protein FPL14_04240 [Cohnella cholangitidis]
MEQADDAFDFVTLIAALIIFTPILVFIMVPFLKGDVGGFDVQIEKTARVTEAEIIPENRQLTTNDVLLMLAVADKYTPSPNNIRLSVNGSFEIPLDDNFFIDRAATVRAAKAAMPDNVPVKLELFSGAAGLRFWDVQRQ